MSFAKTFEIASYLLLTAGFFCLATAGGVATPIAVLYGVGLLLSWLRGPIKITRRRQFILIGLLFFLFLLDLIINWTFGGATVRLLLGLSLFKAFQRETGSDYLVLYLISFAFVLIASTYTISIIFLVTLILFIFLSILTFILFENREAYRRHPRLPFQISAHIHAAVVISSLSILLSVPIFLAIPRGSLGLMGKKDANVAGFSDSVNLGEIGEILENSEVVMRVSVDRDPSLLPEDLKWRGIAMDQFDGKVWSNTQPPRQELEADASGRIPVVQSRRQQEFLLEQTFTVQPFAEVIFAAPRPIQIFHHERWNSRLWLDGNHSIQIRPRPRERRTYVVHSDVRSRAQQLGRYAFSPLSPDPRFEPYLQLPDLQPRIAQLATNLTIETDDPLRKALILEDFLRSGFEYSLKNPSGGVEDPISDFLFRSRAGHCEYFATSHAVMLRTLGIPSRVVNGFRQGDYNDWGDYFIVRQSDAHSWVEAYFPTSGWVEFDPTPPALGDYAFLYTIATRLIDTIDVVWIEVVTFDQMKQVGFFQSLRDELDAKWDEGVSFARGLLQTSPPSLDGVENWFRRSQGYLPVFLFFAAASFLLYRFRRYLTIFWKRRILRRAGHEIAQEYYRELLDILERKGYRKDSWETPFEFASRLNLETGADLPLNVTETYYRNRYGGHQVSDDELQQVYSALKELRSQRLSPS